MIKVGDKVQLVSKRPDGWVSTGEMDCFLGKQFVVNEVDYEHGFIYFHEDECWAFLVDDIDFVIGPTLVFEVDNIKYITVKAISCEYIWKTGMVSSPMVIREFEKLLKDVGSFSDVIESNDFIKLLLENNKNWIPRLLDLEFIKPVEFKKRIVSADVEWESTSNGTIYPIGFLSTIDWRDIKGKRGKLTFEYKEFDK